MTSVFQVIAHEDNNNQAKPRQAMALATQRVEDRFGSFVRQGSVDDQAARFSLVEADVEAVVSDACWQVGTSNEVYASVLAAIKNNFVTSAAEPQLRTAGVRHEARKPKMCPYHSEVTDISLAAGEAQAGFNAMAQHAWSDRHCQGEGYEGSRCNFKPAMTTQAFWDDKAEKAQQRRDERAELAEQEALQAEPVTELPEVETPEVEPVAEVVEIAEVPVEHNEPSAIGEGVEEVPMAMAASMVKEAPGKEHMKGVGEKRNRQYEHIKEQCLADGGDEERCKEMAARTVNKTRSEKGETKDSSTKTADGGAVPTMDKRKWTPKTVPADQPLKADDPNGRNPTKRKDVVDPITQTPDEPDNKGELKEIGEQVTEHQDVAKDTGVSTTGQGGTFGGGERSAVSSVEGLLSEDAIRTALSKFKQ